jgi:small redox-active disulfide protein 2
MKIEILGTGCPKCKLLEQNTILALEETKIKANIVKVDKIDKIIEYGVLSTPAIIIDGKIKSYGKVNTVEEIKGWL